jgi:hypothetical protein
VVEEEEEELPAEEPQFFSSLSENAPPSAIDEEREEEEDEAPRVSLNSLGQSSAPADEEREEEDDEDDEKEDTSLEEENDKMKEDLEKIDAGLFEDVRLGVNQVYEDIVEEYGDPDGTLRRLLEDDADGEFGDAGLVEAYVEVDILWVGNTPLGLYKGRVFPVEYTEDVRRGIERMEEDADYGVSADSFKQGVDMGRYLGEDYDYEDDRRAMLNDSISKVEWAQAYVLRNATNRLLSQIRGSKFFDAFADKDVVKEIIRKRTGSGKMKGGKFFLSDLFDMLRGKRNLEY